MANIYPEEKGLKIEITIKDENGAAVDVTGATVSFFIKDPDGQEFTKSATIDSPTGGVCSYTTPDTVSITKVGTYIIYPKVVFANGNILFGSANKFEVKKFYE